MNLAIRNMSYYWRGNLAVLLGVAVGAAVLIGALFVGDSLRGSLAERAARQSNGVTASYTGARLLDERLASQLAVTPALMLRGTARSHGDVARVVVIALDADGLKQFGLPIVEGWDHDENLAIVSASLAKRVGVAIDQRLRLSVQQLSTVPRSSLLGRRNIDDLTTSMSFTVKAVVDSAAADFALTPSPEAPLNLFVPLKFLQDRLGRQNRVNAMFAFGGNAHKLNLELIRTLEPADWGLKIAIAPARKAYVSVESDQLLLSPPVVEAVEKAAKELKLHSESTTVYLANWIAANEQQRIPYSVVAALDPGAVAPLGPFLPEGVTTLKDDEIVLTDWPESPLKTVPVGATITLTYFEPEVESGAVEKSHAFKLVGRIPLGGVARDPDLTPPFPGITDKLRIGDWNPPFPFESSRIKAGDVNEQYWDKYKTTPKAYISRGAGEKLFGSRFGSVTSIRVAPAARETPQQTADKLAARLKAILAPESLGIQFDDTHERLAKASVGGTDFGGLFLGFSFFLILAALGLVGLLVRLTVERRARDIGGLLAMGYTPRRIRRMLMLEGFIITVAGTLIGLALAIAYARGLILILVDLWPDGSVKALLKPHLSVQSAVIGGLATILMAMFAIWFGVRGLVKLPIPMLLRGRTEVLVPSPPLRWRGAGVRGSEAAKTLATDSDHATPPSPNPLPPQSRGESASSWSVIGILACVITSVIAHAVGPSQSNPDFRAMAFFSGGGLLFIAGLLLIRRNLAAPTHSQPTVKSLRSLGFRNARRFPGRSTLTIFLLGSATFLLVAVESFRRKPDHDFTAKTGGSGGFELIADLDVPILQPFDREPGKSDFLDLFEKEHQISGEGSSAIVREQARIALDGLEVMPLRRHGGDDASCLNLYQAAQPTILGVPDALIERGGFKFSMSEAATDAEKANPWLLLNKPREDGAIPVIGEQNSVMWMLKKAVGDEIELPDGDGNKKRFRIVATLQDSVFQSELLMSDTSFQKLYPRDEGYSKFLISPSASTYANVWMLYDGLKSHGIIVSRSKDRVASYQAVVGSYLTTFQLLGGLGLLLGVLGLAAIVLRGVWDRIGEFALLSAVGYSPRDVRTLVLAENLLLLLLGISLGFVTAIVSVLPQGGELITQLARLAALLGIVIVVGVVTVVIATRAALRTPLVEALRSE